MSISLPNEIITEIINDDDVIGSVASTPHNELLANDLQLNNLKADKIIGATNGNIVTMDSFGNIRDDGINASDFELEFSKNSAFNKDFGLVNDSVSRGDHVHGIDASLYGNVFLNGFFEAGSGSEVPFWNIISGSANISYNTTTQLAGVQSLEISNSGAVLSTDPIPWNVFLKKYLGFMVASNTATFQASILADCYNSSGGLLGSVEIFNSTNYMFTIATAFPFKSKVNIIAGTKYVKLKLTVPSQASGSVLFDAFQLDPLYSIKTKPDNESMIGSLDSSVAAGWFLKDTKYLHLPQKNMPSTITVDWTMTSPHASGENAAIKINIDGIDSSAGLWSPDGGATSGSGTLTLDYTGTDVTGVDGDFSTIELYCRGASGAVVSYNITVDTMNFAQLAEDRIY